MLFLPQHVCSWHSGRPHMKQTKVVKLIIMPFFVVVALSAEESTDHISCPSLLKVSQNAGKRFLYCIHHIIWPQPQEIYFQAHTSLDLPWRSLLWVLCIFCLLSSQLLKAWRRKQARGNPWDMMVQRKRVLCCLPPTFWVSCCVSLFLIMPHPLGENPPYTWQKQVFFSHMTVVLISGHHRATRASFHLLITLTLPLTALSKIRLLAWAWGSAQAFSNPSTCWNSSSSLGPPVAALVCVITQSV